MNEILGPANTLLNYAIVVLLYGALFVVMQHAYPWVELNFRKSFTVLFWGWSVGVFIGNYVFFLLGFMSFLPWLNNALHTFVWIGLGLGFLYAGCYWKPLWMQCVLFAIFSLVVKAVEHDILGTWEMDNFFGLKGNDMYIVGWSLMDGLYPIISMIGLRAVGWLVPGVMSPRAFTGMLQPIW